MKPGFKGFLLLLVAPLSLFAQKEPDLKVEETYTEKVLKFERKPSIISLPLDISIEDIQAQINKGLPELIYEDASFEDNKNDDFKVKVWRKGNLVFTSLKNDVFSYEVPLKIWAQKRVSALGYSQTPATTFEMKLRFTSRFFIGQDWSLNTQTTPNGYEWISKPVLKVGYVDIPLSPIVGKLIDNNHASFAKQIDQVIKENYSLKPYLIDAWNMAKKPFLASEEYHTWVKVEPVDIFLTPLKTVGQDLKTTIGFKVFVETIVGKEPEAPKPVTQIPLLKTVDQIPEVFEVSLFNVISYEEATRISKTMFEGQTFEFRKGKYKISITDMSIYGSKEYLVIEVQTKGNLKGTIYLKGIPKYDPVSRQVVLTQTELDIKSKSFLVKAASWLLEGTLEKKVEKDFGLPMDDIIKFAKASVESTINTEFSKGVKMSGVITEVVPGEVQVSEEGILAIVNSKAKVQLKVKGL
ncbi:DUF4403 family protein [Emticicia sp. CRIBPO]|uniref:DUF4403 family protein n=1 Tax=Emticicia sp. CRIBPO TaxID=2683258 RepID=UPI0014129B52|nr:DUF4403 family protein [Emticicia sp. CRIBPO]NBA87647.1 DUF4403 family protein [Emticicia sp. CRIBPO]